MTLRVCGEVVGMGKHCRLLHGHLGPHESRGAWYVVGTVDDAHRLDDGHSPLAILGPWPHDVAQQKRDLLRTNHPDRQFEIYPENQISAFRSAK